MITKETDDKDSNMNSFIIPATQRSDSSPISAHLLNGNRFKADVKAGTVITYDMVEASTNSLLWKLREEQEKLTP